MALIVVVEVAAHSVGIHKRVVSVLVTAAEVLYLVSEKTNSVPVMAVVVTVALVPALMVAEVDALSKVLKTVQNLWMSDAPVSLVEQVQQPQLVSRPVLRSVAAQGSA